MLDPPPFDAPSSSAEFVASFKEGKELGRGRFGTALLVTHVSSASKYCLKRTQYGAKGQMSADKVAIESDALSRLQHPNIIRCFGTFTEEQSGGRMTMCILMEFANGGDLASLLARRWWDATRLGQHQLPEEMLMDWFVQLAAGLTHAHSMKVLHRDLKPEIASDCF